MNSCSGCRTVSTGQGAMRTTFSATLPITRWLNALRPCVPMMTTSLPASFAWLAISTATLRPVLMTVTALSPHATGRLYGPVALFTVALGILATLASSFIYLLPARPSWNLLHTPLDFLISAGLLGSVASGLAHTSSTASTLALASAWILNQAVRLYRLRTSTMFELRSSYNLLTSDALLPYLYASFGCVVAASAASITGHPIVGVLLCWAGLLAGRYLFFVSVVPLKMGLTFLQGRHA